MADRLTIQRFPKSLPDFFGMQASGDVPPVLAEQIIATVEVGTFYALDRLKQTRASAGAFSTAGALLAAAVTVPAGEVWDIVAIDCAGVCNNAAQSLSICPMAFFGTVGGGSTYFTDATYSLTASAAGEPWACGKHFAPRSLILPPGCQVGGYAMKVVNGGGNFTANQVQATYYRYLI